MKDVMIPPTIGAAIRFITSAPEPVDHMMGKSPIRIAITVIILGRTRCTAPSRTACSRSLMPFILPAFRSCS